jgi:hypothetical protein
LFDFRFLRQYQPTWYLSVRRLPHLSALPDWPIQEATLQSLLYLMMIVPKPRGPKNQYCESQAAAQLGISVEQLRQLVKKQVGPDEDLSGLPMAMYNPSDLLLLRLLVTLTPPSTL